MKNRVLSTYKMLMNKSLNKDIDESWIDWAIEMIEAGFTSEYLYVLAGISQPFNQFELQELTSNVLKDLKFDYSNKDLVVKNYVYFLVTTSIDRPATYLDSLREIKDICIDLDMHDEYMVFYLLYFAKGDLIESDNQWYWDGVDSSNIDLIMREELDKWKRKFELT